MDFDFKSINILIGPQGSGKSVTVKLMYFFKNFINEIVKNIENEESKRDLDKNQKEIFLNFFPKETWPKDDFLIVYKNNITSISLKKVDSKIIFEYSENLKKLLKKGKKIYTSEKAKYANDHKISNFRFKRELSDKITKDNLEEEEIDINEVVINVALSLETVIDLNKTTLYQFGIYQKLAIKKAEQLNNISNGK